MSQPIRENLQEWEQSRSGVRGNIPPPSKKAGSLVATTQAFIANTIATAGQVKVLPAKNTRGYLLVQNRSAATVFLSFGTAIDTTANIAIEIAPGGNFEPIYVPVSDVYIAGSVDNSLVSVTEGVFQ